MNPAKLFAVLMVFLVGNVFAGQYSEIRSYVKPIVLQSSTSGAVRSGSGTVIAPGYILSVSHLIPEAGGQYDIYLGDKTGGSNVKLTVVKINRELDLSLLKGDFQCPCAPITRQIPELDQDIFSVGYPLYTKYDTQFVSTGIIQKIFEGQITSSLTSAPGASGGGEFLKVNGRYELVAVTMSIAVFVHKRENPENSYVEFQNWITFAPGPGFIRDFLSDTTLSTL